MIYKSESANEYEITGQGKQVKKHWQKRCCRSGNSVFISMVLLRIPAAVQPLTGIEGFIYQAGDGLGSAIHNLFFRDFAAMGSSLFDPHAKFLAHSAE